MGPLPARVPVLVGLEMVTVVLVLELEVVVVELDVVVVVEEEEEEVEALDEPTDPVPEMTGVPVGREPLDEGMVTTTVPLPVLTTGVLGLLEPEPEPPEPPWPPEPVDTGVVGVAETGAGVVTTGTVTVVAPPPEPPPPEPPRPEPPLPEPPLPLPEPPPPVPVLPGAELCVGRLPATGCEIVAEVVWRAELWLAVPWPARASSVRRLLATAAGTPPAAPARGLTTLTEASPREAWAPALGWAVSVCVAGDPTPPSLGHPL
jgi:hypothetical protein